MSGYDLGSEQAIANTSETGRVVPFLHPVTGEPVVDGDTPVTITVAGRLSERYRKAADAYDRAAAKRRTQGADALYERHAAILAACIVNWQGLTLRGEPFPYSPENAKTLVATMPRLRDALWVEVHDDAAFFAANSPSS